MDERVSEHLNGWRVQAKRKKARKEKGREEREDLNNYFANVSEQKEVKMGQRYDWCHEVLDLDASHCISNENA